MLKEKKKKPKEVTRRQFLAGTGIVVGGAAIGSAALLAACGGKGETETVTQTQTATQTVTTTQQVGTATVTTTAPGPTTTQTVTETISQYVCPYDDQVFGTVSALATHLEVEHPTEELTRLTVNGAAYQLKVEPYWSLAKVLREQLGLTGTKLGCKDGSCGACAVLLEGKAVLSCLMLAIECKGKEITTIEGLAKGEELHPIQEAFIEHMGFQCGFCTPAMILSTKALLDTDLNPTREGIQEALSAILCRCGGYNQIFDSVLGAANTMRGGA
jgi:aerobic-type carbon monoxide dehydrogenase small subunit (CoxS/CutS family)